MRKRKIGRWTNKQADRKRVSERHREEEEEEKEKERKGGCQTDEHKEIYR